MSAATDMRMREDGLWRLLPGDRAAALEMLRQRPEHNAYLLAQIARGAMGRDDVAGPMIGFWRAGALQGICVLGSNLVISTPASHAAVAAFGDYARRSGVQFWVAVGEDATVLRFLDSYGRGNRQIRLERGGQVLYALGRHDALPPGRDDELRLADTRDVEALILQDHRMVAEEIGFDPFARVMPVYRQGWLRRVREGRAWVMGPLGGPLHFKVDHSAASSDVVQLAGIYTAPGRRREGIARRGVREMCHHILSTTPLVTLYVNAANTPAVRLYDELGFRAVGSVRTVWFDV